MDNLIVEIDAKGLKDILDKPANATDHELEAVVANVLELLDRNWNVEVTWVKRDANELAHLLASMAFDNKEEKEIYMQVPDMAKKTYEVDPAGFML